MPCDLRSHKLRHLPELYLIENYLDQAEEERIIREVQSSQAKWVQLSGRRLQNHGGIVHAKGLIPTPLPNWLQQLTKRVQDDVSLFGDKQPNHVLINSYRPGEGIMPHQDGPLYLPVVAILSLGSPAVLRFWRKQPEGGTGGLPPVASVLAQPRSLLIFCKDAYEDCLHGIEEVSEELLDATVVNAGGSHHMQQLAGEQLQCSCNCMGSSLPPAPSEPAGAAPPASSAAAAAPAGAATVDAAAAAAAGTTAEGSDQQQHQHRHEQQQEQQVLVPSVPRTGERISLTIRHVVKVKKALLLGRR